MVSIKESTSLKDVDLILPPDVTPRALRAAFSEFSKVVGSENIDILTVEQMLPDSDGHYFNLLKEHDLFYALEKDTFLASAVLAPGSTNEVTAIVRLANKYLAPLWPVSRGRNLGLEPSVLEMFGCAHILRIRRSGSSLERKCGSGHGSAHESNPECR